jgi:predicted MFS family arabinose efflux permease
MDYSLIDKITGGKIKRRYKRLTILGALLQIIALLLFGYFFNWFIPVIILIYQFGFNIEKTYYSKYKQLNK